MKSTELRIGNWIKLDEGEYYKVVSITDHPNDYEYFSGIPLTPEILEKAGFDSCCDGNEYRIGLPLGNGTDFVIETLHDEIGPYDCLINDKTGDQYPSNYSYLKPLKYLHQLQNLYYALTGEELEIKL